MARNFASIVCLALLSQVLSAPVPGYPETYYGTYESVPELDQNFKEFASVFNLPPGVDLDKPTFLYYYKDGEYNVERIVFDPRAPAFEMRWKFGEPTTMTFMGKTIEYVWNVEDSEPKVFKGKFKCVETGNKFTIEGTPTPTGFTVTYTREGVTARRTYNRSVCPTIGGFYLNVAEKQSPNFIELANRVFPAPAGLSWDSKTGLWLGRWGKDFVVKYLPTPTVHAKFPFRFGEKRTTEINGKTITYEYTLVEENFVTKTVTLRGEFSVEGRTLTLTAVITPEGISATYKAGEETATRYYRRVMNPMVFGTYNNVPEASENWGPFTAALGKPDDNVPTTKFEITREGETNYVQATNGNTPTEPPCKFPFSLNTPYENTAPNGVPVKYTFTERPSYSNDYYMHAENKFGDKAFEIDMFFNATGVTSYYRYGSLTAKRFYRRSIPTTYLTKYQSNPDTPEFAQFIQTVGVPLPSTPTKIELGTSPDGRYYKTISVDGKEPKTFPFELGKTYETELMGTPFKYVFMYFSVPKPVIHTYWWDANNTQKSFSVAVEFTDNGYTAYYQAKGRLASRTYTRV